MFGWQSTGNCDCSAGEGYIGRDGRITRRNRERFRRAGPFHIKLDFWSSRNASGNSPCQKIIQTLRIVQALESGSIPVLIIIGNGVLQGNGSISICICFADEKGSVAVPLTGNSKDSVSRGHCNRCCSRKKFWGHSHCCNRSTSKITAHRPDDCSHRRNSRF